MARKEFVMNETLEIFASIIPALEIVKEIFVFLSACAFWYSLIVKKIFFKKNLFGEAYKPDSGKSALQEEFETESLRSVRNEFGFINGLGCKWEGRVLKMELLPREEPVSKEQVLAKLKKNTK